MKITETNSQHYQRKRKKEIKHSNQSQVCALKGFAKRPDARCLASQAPDLLQLPLSSPSPIHNTTAPCHRCGFQNLPRTPAAQRGHLCLAGSAPLRRAQPR